MPAAYTSAVSVQVPGFEDICLLTHCGRLLCDSCSSGQCFAFGFLRIPPRGGHPCRSADRSPCRADSGLTPPSHPVSTTCTGTAPVTALRAMPGAQKKRAPPGARSFRKISSELVGHVEPEGGLLAVLLGDDTRWAKVGAEGSVLLVERIARPEAGPQGAASQLHVLQP